MGSEEILTDKQLGAIIEMVMQIFNRAKDLDDAKKALQTIKRGGDEDEDDKIDSLYRLRPLRRRMEVTSTNAVFSRRQLPHRGAKGYLPLYL